MNRTPYYVVSRGYSPADEVKPITLRAFAVRAIGAVIFLAIAYAAITPVASVWLSVVASSFK